jgi:anti-sigma-K factor RskA
VRRRHDAAAYVLGGLPPQEESRLRGRERDDPPFTAEVRRLRELTGILEAMDAAGWDGPTPPPLDAPGACRASPDRARLRPAGARGASLGSRRRRRRSGPLVLRPLPAALGAAALLAAGAAGGALLTSGDDPSTRATRGAPLARIALEPIGRGPAGARAEAVLAGGATRRMTLTVTGLPSTDLDAFYEIWMLRTPKELVSVGTFRVGADGRATVSFAVAADARRFPVVDVSRERADGDPGHSTVSVLRSRPVSS